MKYWLTSKIKLADNIYIYFPYQVAPLQLSQIAIKYELFSALGAETPSLLETWLPAPQV
jgi:hypothetical protein